MPLNRLGLVGDDTGGDEALGAWVGWLPSTLKKRAGAWFFAMTSRQPDAPYDPRYVRKGHRPRERLNCPIPR